MSKALVCPCEDVTFDNLDHAVSHGHTDIESIKRFTGFGTGMCQGKSCMPAVSAYLHRKGLLPPEAQAPFTARPPLQPTRLAVLASDPVPAQEPPIGGTPPTIELSTPALKPDGQVPARAKIVIIGGGVMGLSLAHNLALRGETDVVVLEQGYLLAGATGRNGGGVRMQWGTAVNVGLARRSIELMKGFAREFGINLWLRQGGYLFLAKSAEVADRLEKSVAVQNAMGVQTRLIEQSEASELVPDLSLRGVRVAAFNPDDGVIFPWPFLWGYAQSCKRHGIAVETFTRVTGFKQSGAGITHVVTDRGEIACETVVLAAGAWSPPIAQLAGVTLPNQPHRHEICSTEPLKPFLGPLVSVLDSGIYFSQSMRGEIVGGMGDPLEPAGLQMGSTMRFASRYASALQELLPTGGNLKILRQWAGCYDVTPDHNPVLGRTPGVENLLQLNGFVGHGVMMAPAVGERMAAWMTGAAPDDDLFTRFNLQRFIDGRLEKESMIIG
ncbi:MAG TPA: FAD-dependent oxidoreductase [Myxococcaceae bacterium]|nr:FAD-dependent oxidoreductase [Myxococcaceae bacterium]